jgi:hypothetical protein
MRAYREEVRDLDVWCQDNNLSLNVIKTKETIVDYGKRMTEHSPILIDGAEVEQVESFKFLGVHITNKLSWSKHTKSFVKRAQESIFYRPVALTSVAMKCFERLVMAHINTINPETLDPQETEKLWNGSSDPQSSTAAPLRASCLTDCVNAWYANCSASDHKALQRVVRTARYIIGAKLPAIQDLNTSRCQRKALKMFKDSSHPSHRLFFLLLHGKQYRSTKSRSRRLLN